MGDAAGFISQGIANAKQAITADRAGNFAEALRFYDETLKSLRQAVACDTNEQRKVVTQKKAKEYEQRKTQLQQRMNKKASSPSRASPNRPADVAQPSNYHAVPLKNSGEGVQILCLWVTDSPNAGALELLRKRGMKFLMTATFAEGMQMLRKNTEITHVVNNVHRAGGKLAATHELIDMVRKYEASLPIVLTTFEMDTSNPKKFQKRLQEIQLELQGCMRMGATAIANSADELAQILSDPAHLPDRSKARVFESQLPRSRLPRGKPIYNQNGLEYFLADVIGAGNFGVIHNVSDCFGQQYVAKVLKSNRASEEVEADWAKEVQFLYTLNHPNIVQLYDAFQHENVHYLVMERCDGTLREYIEKHGPMSEADVVSTGGQILAGLHHIHQRNIIHRDVHADNILTCAPRHPNQQLCIKITDFGISKLLKPTENAAVTFIGRDYDYCLAENHEILTSSGFMDLDCYKKRQSDDLLVAGYDPRTQQLVFQRPNKLIENARCTQPMVEFVSDQASQVRLLVTPDHRMFVKQKGVTGHNEMPGFEIVTADELLSGKADAVQFLPYALHGYTFADGIDDRGDNDDVDDERSASSSSSCLSSGTCSLLDVEDAQNVAFLWLYGFWRACRMQRPPAHWSVSVDARNHDVPNSLQVTFSGDSTALDAALLERLCALNVEARSAVNGSNDVVAVFVAPELVELLGLVAAAASEPDAGRHHEPAFASWVWRQQPAQLRTLLEGFEAALARPGPSLCRSAAVSCPDQRDQLVQLLLQAGCSASFSACADVAAPWLVSWADPKATDNCGECTRMCRPEIPIAPPSVDGAPGVRTVPYTGRTWCFSMPSGFIVARSASKNGQGQVISASRPVILGNCPELVTKGHTTKRSDVYQLGLVLYHVYTGKHALSAEDGINVVQIVTSGLARTRAEQLKTKLGDVIGIMLRRAPEYRYKDCIEAWSHLSAVV